MNKIIENYLKNFLSLRDPSDSLYIEIFKENEELFSDLEDKYHLKEFLNFINFQTLKESSVNSYSCSFTKRTIQIDYRYKGIRNYKFKKLSDLIVLYFGDLDKKDLFYLNFYFSSTENFALIQAFSNIK